MFAFVVAKALVTDIERLRKASPNGQLQPNDILNYFAGELKVCPLSQLLVTSVIDLA